MPTLGDAFKGGVLDPVPVGLRIPLLALAVVAAMVTAGGLVLSAPVALTVGALLTTAFALAIVSFFSWEFGVFAFFAWLTIEDLVRKFTGNAMAAYMAKDLIYFAALIGFAIAAWRHRVRVMPNPILIPLMGLALWALVMMIPAAEEHPLIPLLGIRMSFLYVPLLYLGYAFVLNGDRWHRFILLNVILGVGVALVGIAQFAFGLGILNPRADSIDVEMQVFHAFTGTTGVPRPNAVFLHAGRASAYMFSILCVAATVFAFNRGMPRLRKFGLAAGSAIIFASLILSGQRVTVPLVALGISVILGAWLWTAPTPPGRKLAILAATVGGAGALFGAAALIRPQFFALVMAFYSETFLSEGLVLLRKHVGYGYTNLVDALTASWLGHGTGTSSLGKQYVHAVDLNTPGLYFTEGGFASVAWEWGIIGLALWVTLTVWLSFVMVKRLSTVRGTSGTFIAALGILVFTLSVLGPWFYLSSQNYQNYVTQSFLWFLVGAFFGMTAAAQHEVPGTASHSRRIAIVSPFLDLRHGTERCIVEQAKGLAAEGHEIHIYSQRVEDVPGVARWRRGAGGAGKIYWHRVPRLRILGAIDYVWWFVMNHAVRALDRDLRGLWFDIVLSPGVNALDADIIVVHIVFAEYRRLAGDDLKLAKNPLRAWPALLHRRIYYAMIAALERRVYTRPSTRIGAVSGLTADEVARHYGRTDVGVVLNAVDTAMFSPNRASAQRQAARARLGLGPDDVALLLVGNDWKKKGLPAALEALAVLRNPKVRLVVRGRDDRAAFDRRIRELKLSDQVIFDPPAPEVLPAYAAADIYIGPSLHDSFALPPLEAMACGVPTITSLNNGGSRIIEDGVDGYVLSDPGNAKDLARILAPLIEDPELRARVGAAGARKASQFTWKRSIDDLRALASGFRRSNA